MRLTEQYREHYEKHRETIRQRLAEFEAIGPEEYLHELMFCLLTPQSRAAHAEQVMTKLRAAGFPESPVDPVPYLRDPSHYIRFHNQKGARLVAVAARGDEIRGVLTSTELDAMARREWLVANVNGLGWKEASHFLRNIGHLDLAIIDRHVLKHMLATGAIEAIPKSVGTRRVYLELESRFRALADDAGMSLQELDLLFWSLEEGSVRK